MAKRPEIICLIGALLCTFLTKYTQSTKPVYHSQPPPRRFFPPSSPVQDIYYGSFQELASLMFEKNMEMAFVMYYAPWCGKSLYVRGEFDKAARYMHKQVHFVAVNCWAPSGSCRQTFTFPGFPVLFAYHTTLDGFQYHGVLAAEYMIFFLEKLLYPLEYISNSPQMTKFFQLRDNAVLGYFDFNASPQPPGYFQYYVAAMRVTERDPLNPIDFGIVTNQLLAADIDMVNSQDVIYLRTLNETIVYPKEANFTSSELTNWVFKHRQQPSASWLNPSGHKSLQMAKKLRQGPALLMFTPHNPIASPHVQQYFHVLRELSLDYNNCHNSSGVSDSIRRSIHSRAEATIEHLQLTVQCLELQQQPTEPEEPPPVLFSKQCCQTLGSNLESKQNICDICVNFHQMHPFESTDCTMFDLSDIRVSPFSHSVPSCVESMPNYNVNKHISCCCNPKESRQVKPQVIYAKHKDPYVQRIAKTVVRDKCDKMHIRKKLGWNVAVDMKNLKDSLQYKMYEGFTGANCKRNRTLSVYALNSRYTPAVATSLGISLGKRQNQTRVYIYDNKKEEQHLMKNHYTKDNVVAFIQNYTDGALKQHMKSGESSGVLCDQTGSALCITELTSQTFHDVVMDEEKDVLVLYYTPWCGFCAGFAHIILSLAKYFISSNSIIFARINSAENDLPWHLTADSYPSLILFPAGRKADSVAYPHNIAKSLPNLIQFVLRFTAKPLRLETALSICSKRCIHNNFRSIVSRIQQLHNEKQVVARTLVRVHSRLKQYRTLQLTKHSEWAEFYSFRSKMLTEYISQLNYDLKVKDLQISSAKQLHMVLHRNLDKPALEHEKLESIMKEYNMYQSKLKKVTSPEAGADEDSAIEDIPHTEAQNSNNSQNNDKHDEL